VGTPLRVFGFSQAPRIGRDVERDFSGCARARNAHTERCVSQADASHLLYRDAADREASSDLICASTRSQTYNHHAALRLPFPSPSLSLSLSVSLRHWISLLSTPIKALGPCVDVAGRIASELARPRAARGELHSPRAHMDARGNTASVSPGGTCQE